MSPREGLAFRPTRMFVTFYANGTIHRQDDTEWEIELDNWLLKEHVKAVLLAGGHEVLDVGTASPQQVSHRSDCQESKAGVRCQTSSMTSCGMSFVNQASSAKVASNLAWADPSAMHHGHSASSSASRQYTPAL